VEHFVHNFNDKLLNDFEINFSQTKMREDIISHNF